MMDIIKVILLTIVGMVGGFAISVAGVFALDQLGLSIIVAINEHVTGPYRLINIFVFPFELYLIVAIPCFPIFVVLRAFKVI